MLKRDEETAFAPISKFLSSSVNEESLWFSKAGHKHGQDDLFLIKKWQLQMH